MSSSRIAACTLGFLVVLSFQGMAQEAPPTMPAPTLVSLNVNDGVADAVFAELSKQSNYPLVPFDERAWGNALLPRVTVSLENAPFWKAMREVCAITGVTLYSSGSGDRHIMLMPVRQGRQPNSMKCPAVFSGPFMLVAASIQRSSYVDLSVPDKPNRNAGLTLVGYAEPKIKVVRTFYSAEVDEAVDEKGNSLLGPQAQGQRTVMAYGRVGTGSGLTWQMYVGLQTPPGTGEKIAKLRGKAKVSIQTKSEVLEIPDILKAEDVTKTVAGYTITFKKLTKTNDTLYSADIVLSREGGLDQQQISELMTSPSARLIDEQSGQEYAGMTGGWGGGNIRVVVNNPGVRGGADAQGGKQEIKLQFYARNRIAGAEPTKLVWEFTTEAQELAIPFEFTDLPLP